VYYALALFAVALTAVVPGHRLPLRMPALLERLLSQPAVVPLAVVTLVAAQHACLVLLLSATYHQHPVFGALVRMPIRFISSRGPHHLGTAYGDGFAALVLIESLALFALYWGLATPTRAKFGCVAFGALLACCDAVVSRAATSADMYAYVGFALLGARAYAPPASAFAGAYSVINTWWHTPLVPAVYGPLWLLLAAGVSACGHTLLAKIVALRILGALTLAGTVGILAALKLPPRVIALVALNPALIFEFVVNVHNDLFGVLLLLGARYATMRGSTWGGIALAAAAGLVKLPFMLFAALAFTPLASPVRRARAWGASLAIALCGSWLAGGSAYLGAVRQTAERLTAGHLGLALTGAPVVLKAATVAALALTVASGTFVEGCAWALPAFGAILYPWYLSWTLPYAAASASSLRNVAIALPVAMLEADGALATGTLLTAITAAACLWFGASLVRALVQRFAVRVPA